MSDHLPVTHPTSPAQATPPPRAAPGAPATIDAGTDDIPARR
jgi:hypothetical protein